MTAFETIEIESEATGIARLWLNRPEKHNALDGKMIAELTEAAGSLATDEGVRVVILGARGKSFCAGGDLEWMRAQARNSPERRSQEAKALARMLEALDTLPKPLIGRVHGQAYGGGIGLISVCDTAIAEPGCRFALTETRLGLIPATIGPFVVRRMGEGNARRVFFTGRPFDSDGARMLGLVAEVVAPENLDEAVGREAGYALDCAPQALARAKALCQALARQSREDEIDFTARQLVETWETEEARSGIDAFFARTPPPWKVED